MLEKANRIIKELRKEKGFSQRQLATYSGISNATISDIESGNQGVTLKTAKQLAKGLRMSEVEFFNAIGLFGDETVAEVKPSSTSVVRYGTIFAGAPQGAEEDIDGETEIPSWVAEKYGVENLISLKISGDSMNNIIPDGYIGVFLTDYEPIENGKIYGVLINDETVTLKRVYKYDDYIRFEPDSTNPDNKPWTYYKNQDINVTVKYVGKLVYSVPGDFF